MQVAKLFWNDAGWAAPSKALSDADLVLYFGERRLLAGAARYLDLKRMFPRARIVGCSTGGQILGDDVSDGTLVAVAIRFKETTVRLAHGCLAANEDSRA